MCVCICVCARAHVHLPGLRCKTALSRLCYFIHEPVVDYPGGLVAVGVEVGLGNRGVDTAAVAR